MNPMATQWLNDMVDYENTGGVIPEDVRSELFHSFCVQNWCVVVYDVPFNLLTDSFATVANWIEQNGPDMPRSLLPKPIFGL